MNKNDLPGLSPLWLISLAMVLAVIVVMIPVAILGSDKIKASDWIGFAGNVLAAVMTILAAIIAWLAVQHQIRVQRQAIIDQIERENEARRAQEVEAKTAAIVVLRHPIFALAAVSKAIQERLEIAEKAPAPLPTNEFIKARDGMERAIGRLRATMSHFAIAQAWQNLGGKDRAHYLAVSSVLSTLVIVLENPPEASSLKVLLRAQRRHVTRFAKRLRQFDDGLADDFDKASTKTKEMFRDPIRSANRG